MRLSILLIRGRNVLGRGESNWQPEEQIEISPVIQNWKTYFNEWLHFASACQLFLTHTSRYFSGVAFDSSNNRMGEGPALVPVIQLLDNYNLFTGLTTLENNGDLKQRWTMTSEADLIVFHTLPGLYTIIKFQSLYTIRIMITYLWPSW